MSKEDLKNKAEKVIDADATGTETVDAEKVSNEKISNPSHSTEELLKKLNDTNKTKEEIKTKRDILKKENEDLKIQNKENASKNGELEEIIKGFSTKLDIVINKQNKDSNERLLSNYSKKYGESVGKFVDKKTTNPGLTDAEVELLIGFKTKTKEEKVTGGVIQGQAIDVKKTPNDKIDYSQPDFDPTK